MKILEFDHMQKEYIYIYIYIYIYFVIKQPKQA